MPVPRADGIIQYEIVTGCQSDSPNAKKWALDCKLVCSTLLKYIFK